MWVTICPLKFRYDHQLWVYYQLLDMALILHGQDFVCHKNAKVNDAFHPCDLMAYSLFSG